MGGLATLLGRDFATISVRSRSELPVIAGSSSRLSEGSVRSYVDYFRCRDIFSAPAWNISARRAVLRDRILPREVFEKSEVFNDFYKREGLIDCMALAVDHSDSRMLVVVARRAGEPALDPADVRTLSALGPHFETAFEIHNVTRLAGAASASPGPLENLPFGFAVVSALGELDHANARFRALLDEADRLCLHGGRVTAARSAQAAELNRLVEMAAGLGAAPVGGSMSIGAGGPGDRLSVTLTPVTGAAGLGTPEQGGVSVLVIDPRRPATWTVEGLQQIFGLTFSEARIAVLLAAGIPTTEIADRLHLQTASVRAHLKAVFAKTDTHSQVELVHALLSAAPIAPATTG
jgi:DNA-binding CsgD family transcriptional regulator